jgi:hypothetical protein
MHGQLSGENGMTETLPPEHVVPPGAKIVHAAC